MMSNLKTNAILCIIVIIISLCAGYIVGYACGHNDAQKEDGQKLNEFFNNQYDSYIKNEGQLFIDAVVAKTQKYGNNSERINQIAYLITQEFSDPIWADIADLNGEVYWEKYFYGNSSDSAYKVFINNSLIAPQYWFEKRGKVRVTNSDNNPIFWNPRWIAYQKTGECQELSVLFNATANKAGIETRIVRSDGAYGTGHFWNEVNVSGKWQYFDLQQYGAKKNTNDSAYWFGNTSDYAGKNFNSKECDLTKYGVYILDLQNAGYMQPPITESYDPNNLCKHGTRKI